MERGEGKETHHSGPSSVVPRTCPQPGSVFEAPTRGTQAASPTAEARVRAGRKADSRGVQSCGTDSLTQRRQKEKQAFVSSQLFERITFETQTKDGAERKTSESKRERKRTSVHLPSKWCSAINSVVA